MRKQVFGMLTLLNYYGYIEANIIFQAGIFIFFLVFRTLKEYNTSEGFLRFLQLQFIINFVDSNPEIHTLLDLFTLTVFLNELGDI